MTQELDLDELRATYDHPADKSVIEVINRLEQAEQRVALLESGIVAGIVNTSVFTAKAIGTEVSNVSESILNMGYPALRGQLEQAEEQVARVREVLKAESFEVREYVTYKAVPVECIEEALDGEPNG